ncbi:MAG: acyl-CoA dehydrogenase family protein [Chitinophagales bacterium]
MKAAYALTEPSSGSDANSGKTSATLNKKGTHYVLNGQKMWITNGGFADVFIVFAKIDDDKNMSAFIVEKAFGGIELGAEEKLGIKASSTVQVFFNNCEVPVENLLSERAEGFKIALNILNSGEQN